MDQLDVHQFLLQDFGLIIYASEEMVAGFAIVSMDMIAHGFYAVFLLHALSVPEPNGFMTGLIQASALLVLVLMGKYVR